MLTHIKKIIGPASRGHYAVGAFNTVNMETTLAIVRAAAAIKSPLIIQISESTISYAGLTTIFAIIKTIVSREAPGIDIAVHLDHGHDIKIIKACLEVGFSSIHMDASDKPFNQNVALTKKAAHMAHSHGAWAQGELGSLFGKEGMTKIDLPSNASDYLTDPAKVKEFVKRTDIDTLAVAVGTLHGSFKGQEKIDFPRLTEITKQVKTPLVLHGGSGVKAADIKRAVREGIRIVNIDTDSRIAFTTTLRQTLKEVQGHYDPRKILAPSIEAVKETVIDKIKWLSL